MSETFPTHDFDLVLVDTDSCFFSKKTGEEFTPEEQTFLLKELNSLYPDLIRFEHNGYFKKVIVLRSKNYVMQEGNKVKYKGSGILATLKEPALKQYIKDIIQLMLEDRTDYTEVYNRYVKEIMDVKDIIRWCSKKTITDKVLDPKRTNEQKVLTAISAEDFAEGDKMYFFFLPDNSLSVSTNFTGIYNKEKLLEKLYKTSLLFENVIPVKELFLNYKLKRNQVALKELTGSSL